MNLNVVFLVTVIFFKCLNKWILQKVLYYKKHFFIERVKFGASMWLEYSLWVVSRWVGRWTSFINGHSISSAVRFLQDMSSEMTYGALKLFIKLYDLVLFIPLIVALQYTAVFRSSWPSLNRFCEYIPRYLLTTC